MVRHRRQLRRASETDRAKTGNNSRFGRDSLE